MWKNCRRIVKVTFKWLTILSGYKNRIIWNIRIVWICTKICIKFLVSGQTPGREHSPTHQQKIGLKIYWAWPWLSFAHSQILPSGSLHKPLILIHQRADRMKTTITENHSLPVSKHLQNSILICFSENQKVFEQEIISFKSICLFVFEGLTCTGQHCCFTPMTQWVHEKLGWTTVLHHVLSLSNS